MTLSSSLMYSYISVSGQRGSYDDDGPGARISALRGAMEQLETAAVNEQGQDTPSVDVAYDMIDWIATGLQSAVDSLTRNRYKVYLFTCFLSFIVSRLHTRGKCQSCKDYLE